jgi:serine protease DegQ
MTTDLLASLSNAFADSVAAVADSVVQVQGDRRPASGLVYAEDVVVTTARALGREDGLHVRRPDGHVLEAELAGWDPATTLAVLRVPSLGLTPIRLAAEPPRVGHMALAVARSWSNAVTASAGLVSIIGGPLATGPRRAIAEVIRTSAPMHDGFAGGAFVAVTGGLLGMATSTSIRGLRVIIPAPLVWKAAAAVVEHGALKRGYLGLAGQPVALPERQQLMEGRRRGLLVVGVTPDSPAAAAGVLVGDVLVALDGQAIDAPDDLLDLLVGDRVGRVSTLRVVRGDALVDLSVTVGERPGR